MPHNIKLDNFDSITTADLTLGDLTVLTGTDSAGKTALLETFKLLLDGEQIMGDLYSHNIDLSEAEPHQFLDFYHGRGKAHQLDKTSEFALNVGNRKASGGIDKLVPRKIPKTTPPPVVFHIPATRSLAIHRGLPHNFLDFDSQDPFAIRHFSSQLRHLLMTELSQTEVIFPKPRRLNKTLQEQIGSSFFGGGGELRWEMEQMTRRLAIKPNGMPARHTLGWTSAQLEFVPLLLSMYWLCPEANGKRKGTDWVLVEEPERSLNGWQMNVLMSLLAELLRRGYKLIVATHTEWVFDYLRAYVSHPEGADLLAHSMFSNARQNMPMSDIGKARIKKDAKLLQQALKSAELRIYSFMAGHPVAEVPS